MYLKLEIKRQRKCLLFIEKYYNMTYICSFSDLYVIMLKEKVSFFY